MYNSLTGRRKHRGGQHILLRRGGALRTLGTFILIAGSISLVLGIYLFRGAIAEPSGDQSAALLAAAFSLAGGVVPLLYLLRSVLKRRSAESLDSATARLSATSPVLERRTLTAPLRKGSSQLPFQRIYVDSRRIRPRE
jgi:hypothetical protein